MAAWPSPRDRSSRPTGRKRSSPYLLLLARPVCCPSVLFADQRPRSSCTKFRILFRRLTVNISLDVCSPSRLVYPPRTPPDIPIFHRLCAKVSLSLPSCQRNLVEEHDPTSGTRDLVFRGPSRKFSRGRSRTDAITMPNTASTVSRRSHAASHFWTATRAHLSLSPSLSLSLPLERLESRRSPASPLFPPCCRCDPPRAGRRKVACCTRARARPDSPCSLPHYWQDIPE